MAPKAIRWIYYSIGWLCTGLGVLGAFLPLLPTVPFLLLAFWAFSHSSPRLKDWLYHHPRYGETLRDWFEHGTIGVVAKVVAVSTMLASVVILYLLTGRTLLVSIHLAVMVLVAVFILTRPSVRAEQAEVKSA